MIRKKYSTKDDYFWLHLNDMKAADLELNLVESYLGLLKSLSPDNRLELISKLWDSLKVPKKPIVRNIACH